MGVVELPAPAAAALAAVAGSVPPVARAAAAAALSDRYRAGARSTRGPVVRTPAELAAYAAVRVPATYAAAVAAFGASAAADPGFAPTRLLDVGSGLGATALAATTVWPSLTDVTCVEADPRALAAGRTVLPGATWRAGTLAAAGLDAPGAPADAELVTAGYVLGELVDPVAAAAGLWTRTTGTLVLLEPGRPEGYAAVVAARAAVLAGGGHTVAPCPHDAPCPLRGDWCHLGQRLVRSAVHRRTKGADLPYEDEAYSYAALSRRVPAARPAGRVVARPERRKGLVTLTVCGSDGRVGPVRVPRSSPDHRAAKDAGWGGRWP